MKKQDAEEFTQSLGQIVAGSWRQIALAERLGVPKALGLSTKQWVHDRLGGYVQMSVADRREAVRNLTGEGYSARAIAGIVGVSHETAADDVRNLTPLDAVAALAADDQIRSTAKAIETRQAKEDQRKADLARPVNVVLVSGLYHGDFRQLADEIPDASAQLVFTDPPYDEAAVDLYDDAARIARRILKPGGSFIAYSGARHLPAVLTACSRHLEYWWIVAGLHGGATAVMQRLGIRVHWKPIVWFVKKTRGDVQNILADVIEGSREKDHHEWQQAEIEAHYFIEKLTTEEGLIVDFFAGSGTSAIAAKRLGRRWIGFEINATTAEGASQRIEASA